ncbi:hypothetical protein PSU4_31900 [Pseudonocardia sulfidoxydans NBRC 16205]|uniref:LTD domain-containing protein n=1 Tax=Pseudonocardia sulfidoxydans NBRC 16205 TaxID=1223511 RepID=A0A511DHG6_9PSEU|nr:hypothetical protein [Pseudonocardia sulfidoxydans]GEL24236.1 hypothetical protein PSU4_31900 [Pseudonocardia sulfidoxydans NBRC 16205]
MRMITTFGAATVMAAALLGTAGVSAAAAAPSTDATGVSRTAGVVDGNASSRAVYHRTFTVINNSSYTLALAGYDLTHPDDELPFPDAVVHPQEEIAFNVTYRFLEQREVGVYFTVMDPAGSMVGVYHPVLRVDGGAGLAGVEVREIPDQLGWLPPSNVVGEPEITEVFDRVPWTPPTDAQRL